MNWQRAIFEPASFPRSAWEPRNVVITLRDYIGRPALACVVGLLVLLAGCSQSDHARDSQPAPDETIERKAEKGPVKLLVRVWPREPRLSDLVEMDIIAESQPGVEIKPPAFGQAVGDFLVRDYSERPAEQGDRNARRFHYELEPAHAGKHLIRSVALEFVDRRPGEEGRESAFIETDPLEVTVTSEFGEGAPSLAQLEPMLPPQSIQGPFQAGWILAAGLAGAVAVALLVFARRRKRRALEPRRRSPEELAHAALAALLAEDLPARGLVKEFYLRLTGIVRQFIEDKTGIRAPEQTTEEFLRDMRAQETFSPERSGRLAEFLEAADMIKYAGQQPRAGQLDEAISRAREFVDMQPTVTSAMAAVGTEQ